LHCQFLRRVLIDGFLEIYMIKIRLSKRGGKNSLFYRVVVIEGEKKNTGKYIENIGFFNPAKKEFKIDNDAYKKWIGRGAIASASLKKLLTK